MGAANAEHVYLHEGPVRITNARAVFGSQMYPLANLSSVNFIYETRSPPTALLLVLVLIGLFLVGVSVAAAVAWLVIILIGYFALRRRFYVVIIRSAGGEIRAFETTDNSQAARIVEAMHQAVMGRG